MKTFAVVIFAVVLAMISACVGPLAAQTTQKMSDDHAAQPPEEMTINFSFHGAASCNGSFENPELRLKNVPAGATSVLVTLSQADRPLGGEQAPLSPNGIIRAGSIRTWAPCNPGIYRYDVTARSAAGQTLAKAHQSRSFPSDQVAD